MAHHVDERWQKLLEDLGACLGTEDVSKLRLLATGSATDSMDGCKTRGRRNGYIMLKELCQSWNIQVHSVNKLIEVMETISRCDLVKLIRSFIQEKDADQSRAACTARPSEGEDSGTVEREQIKASPCGICFIISNEKFDEMPAEKKCTSKSKGQVTNRDAGGSRHERPWTCIDEKILKKTFEWLDFDVILERNLTKEQMYDKFVELAWRSHSQYDNFLSFILTHGRKTTDGIDLYGTDWEPLKFNEVRDQFSGNRCKSLAKKPKIFFIQADSVITETTEESPVGHEDGVDGLSHTSKASETIDSTNQEQATFDCDGSTEQCISNVFASDLIPADGNFLITISTLSDAEIPDHATKGSCFVSSICNALQKDAESSHLDEMLRKAGQSMLAKQRPMFQSVDSLDVEPIRFRPKIAWDKFVDERKLRLTSNKQYTVSPREDAAQFCI